MSARWMLGVVVMLPSCGGVSPSPQSPGADDPAIASAEGSAEQAVSLGEEWTSDFPEGLPRDSGVIAYVRLPDGAVVGTVSYSSEEKPFLVYTGRDGELSSTTPPWACAASPPELERRGESVWVHCVEPDTDGSVHFWHTTDGAEWTRVGALGEVVALGKYAIAEEVLWVTGKFEGKQAPLLRVTSNPGGQWKVAAAEIDSAPPSGTELVPAASEEGKQVALLAFESPARERLLWVGYSTDGGKTLRESWSGTWEGQAGTTAAPSVQQGELSFVSTAEFQPVAIVSVPLDGAADLRVQQLPLEADAACVFGPHVAAKSGSKWSVSHDGGATFHEIPAPASPASGREPGLACSSTGIRYGEQTRSW